MISYFSKISLKNVKLHVTNAHSFGHAQNCKTKNQRFFVRGRVTQARERSGMPALRCALFG